MVTYKIFQGWVFREVCPGNYAWQKVQPSVLAKFFHVCSKLGAILSLDEGDHTLRLQELVEGLTWVSKVSIESSLNDIDHKSGFQESFWSTDLVDDGIQNVALVQTCHHE